MTGLLIRQYSSFQKLSYNKTFYKEANSLFSQSRLSTNLLPYTKVKFIHKCTMMTGGSGGGPKVPPPKLPPGNLGPKSEMQLGSYTSEDLTKAPRLTEPVVDPYATKPEYAQISPGKFNDIPSYKQQPGVINVDKSIIKTIQEQRPDLIKETLEQTKDKKPVKDVSPVSEQDLKAKFKESQDDKDYSYENTVPGKPTQDLSLIGIKVLDNARDASGQPLKKHELEHGLIGQKNTKAGTVAVDHMLTSSKKHSITKQPNAVIDEKFNFKNEQKTQRMASLETGRLFTQDQEGIVFKEDSEITAYLKDPEREQKIKDEIKKNSPTHRTVRPHKDAEELYTPDGILHLEDQNIDRDPPVKLTTDTVKDNLNQTQLETSSSAEDVD